MDWVKAEDARSLKIIEAYPNYATYYAEALKISQSPDRLASPDQRGGEIYNLWRDASHVNGIFRKTSLADYLTAASHLEDRHRLRRARQAGQRQVGRPRPQLPLSRRPLLHGRALRRR